MLNHFAAPIDYLLIGHVSSDLLQDGSTTLGGTVSYSALTARALSFRSGILTSISRETSIEPLRAIPMAGIESDHTTTFENIYSAGGRTQKLHHVADKLLPYMLPEVWRNPAIVHFAPLIDEIDLDLFRLFPESLICVTPQGWLRGVKEDHSIYQVDWLEADFVLGQAAAAVLSIEDLGHDERLVEMYAEACDIFVVTEGEKGCRLYEYGRPRSFPAPKNKTVDATGAGDVFAAAFFSNLYRTKDPERSARIAVKLATNSIGRRFLDSIPTESEIYQTMLEEQRTERASSPS